MEQRTSSDKRFALLIDADNVSARYIKPILDELSKYGTVTVKRIYGDWTLSLHAKWKDALLENSITPIQQFGYTQGKNATDSAMIIDAMDVLYTNSVDGFCIVSSDSDFTRLASRLREGGHMVIGMGEKKTPTPFRRACDVFTTLELLVDKREKNSGNGPSMSKEEVEQAVVDIVTDNQNNGKATGLGEVGSRLLKRYPDFDVRSYGTNLLSKLLSEFTRIRITRDHNSIAVELADAPEKAEAPEGSAPKAESPARSDAEAEKTSSAAESAPAAEQASPDQKTEDAPAPVKRSRRSHRVSANSPHESTQDEAKPGAAPSETPQEEPQPADAAEPSAKQAPEVSAPDVQDDTPAPDAETKPARKPTRRRRRKASDKSGDKPVQDDASKKADDAESEPEAAPKASAEDAAKPAEPSPADSKAKSKPEPEPAPEAKSKPRRGRKPKAKPQAQADAPSSGAKKAASTSTGAIDAAAAATATTAPGIPAAASPAPTPKKRGRKPKPRPQASPQDFIRQMVIDAGSTGVELSQIGDAVRAKYTDFKVRDLGFSRLQHYVASIDDFTIEKVGKSTYVKFAE